MRGGVLHDEGEYAAGVDAKHACREELRWIAACAARRHCYVVLFYAGFYK